MLNPYTGPWAEHTENDETELFPNGYRRSEYHRHGISDDDIKQWELDQPNAPPPAAAVWAVCEVIEEMEW